MAVTEDRISQIEQAITTLQGDIKTLVSNLQFNQYVLTNDEEVHEIKDRLDNVEHQIEILQQN